MHLLDAGQVMSREMHHFRCGVPDVVHGHGLGGILDIVEHVIQPRNQAMNLVAVERGDESGMQQGYGVAGNLSARDSMTSISAPAPRLLPGESLEGSHQRLQGFGTQHRFFGMGIEEVKELDLFGHETSEHCELQRVRRAASVTACNREVAERSQRDDRAQETDGFYVEANFL
jgi:hypothetical protein